jgi:hypothetical protein
LNANLQYVKKRAYLVRVIQEAEVFAPNAFERYLEAVNSRYSRALGRVMTVEGAASENQDGRFHVVPSILEGARMRLLLRNRYVGRPVPEISDQAIDTYLHFVSAGIHGK